MKRESQGGRVQDVCVLEGEGVKHSRHFVGGPHLKIGLRLSFGIEGLW